MKFVSDLANDLAKDAVFGFSHEYNFHGSSIFMEARPQAEIKQTESRASSLNAQMP